MPYLTGDTLGTAAFCRRLHILDDPYFREAVSGALLELTYQKNWEQFGSGTPADYAAAAAVMFWDFFNGDTVCMVGSILTFATDDTPDNTLLCDGASYNRVDYPELYEAIASVFHTGADTFVVPDLRDKFVLSIGFDHSIGDTGGQSSVTLTTAQIPSHAHTDTGHAHTDYSPLPGLAVAPGELPVDVPGITPGITGTSSANITNTGGGGSHDNMPPFIALRYCIVVR